jgi:glucose-6-phosphate isomerase
MLAGARKMDQHFLTAPVEDNMPMLLALIGCWYNNFVGTDSQAILPYDNRLDRFPAFLQQLQMESSGKGVRWDGKPVNCDTGQVIWGEPGSNAQHSFYQLLHQGTRFIPVDFILPAESSGGSQWQQDLAIANCLAQAEALMDGYEPVAHEPYRRHPGNRPSNMILMSRLTPNILGQLIALYEHKVFAESVIWGINAFDQFGVELGKRLASHFLPAVRGIGQYEGKNDSTRGLLERLLASRR